MADLKRYREYGDELERRLRSKTFPLAIKLLKKEKDIPEGAQKPLKDFGHHFSRYFRCPAGKEESWPWGRKITGVSSRWWDTVWEKPRIILCRVITGIREMWLLWKRENITPMNFLG
jgi:hypothetical protein